LHSFARRALITIVTCLAVQAIEAEPENRAVTKALAQAEAKAKKSKQTERNMAKKMAKAFG